MEASADAVRIWLAPTNLTAQIACLWVPIVRIAVQSFQIMAVLSCQLGQNSEQLYRDTKALSIVAAVV